MREARAGADLTVPAKAAEGLMLPPCSRSPPDRAGSQPSREGQAEPQGDKPRLGPAGFCPELSVLEDSQPSLLPAWPAGSSVTYAGKRPSGRTAASSGVSVQLPTTPLPSSLPGVPWTHYPLPAFSGPGPDPLMSSGWTGPSGMGERVEGRHLPRKLRQPPAVEPRTQLP